MVKSSILLGTTMQQFLWHQVVMIQPRRMSFGYQIQIFYKIYTDIQLFSVSSHFVDMYCWLHFEAFLIPVLLKQHGWTLLLASTSPPPNFFIFRAFALTRKCRMIPSFPVNNGLKNRLFQLFPLQRTPAFFVTKTIGLQGVLLAWVPHWIKSLAPTSSSKSEILNLISHSFWIYCPNIFGIFFIQKYGIYVPHSFWHYDIFFGELKLSNISIVFPYYPHSMITIFSPKFFGYIYIYTGYMFPIVFDIIIYI